MLSSPNQKAHEDLQDALRRHTEYWKSRGYDDQEEDGMAAFNLLWEMYDFAKEKNDQYRGQNIYWRTILGMVNRNIDDFRVMSINNKVAKQKEVKL